MRVTSEMNFRMLSDAIQRQQSKLLQSQQKISSQKAVSKASDDPGAYGMIGSLSADRSQLLQYSRNVELAKQYHSTANQGLTKAVNLMHRINELVVQAGDGTLESTSREALAKEVDAMLDSMIAVANGSDGGRYTFAGLRTNAAPYETVLDPVDGRIVAVNYVGSEETRDVKIGDALYVATNIPGSSSATEGGIFQTATRDVFDSIIRLRDALTAGDDVSVSDIPDQLQDDLDHLLDNLSLNGVREEQVKTQQSFLLDLQAANLTAKNALEATDVAAETIKYSQAENAYEAALASASRMLQQVNLMDYI